MPLQYPQTSPYNPYNPPTQPANLPKIVLITLAVIVIIAGGFLAYNTWFSGSDDNGNNESIAVGEPNPNGYNCSADIYNCANFTTQAQAQQVYDYCKAQGKGDINRLDADGNGKACEGLS